MDTIDPRDKRNWFAKLHHLHYLYLIIILLLSLIGYLAYCHSGGTENDKQLLTFLSFAATISSIILSVLAIIITVQSSGATERLRDSVMQMSSLPNEIAKRFDTSSSQMNDATRELMASAKENKDVSEKSIAVIKETITKFSEELAERYKGHDLKIDHVSQIVEEALKQAGGGLGPDVIKAGELSKIQVSSFLERTSKVTINLLYFIDKYLQMHLSKPVSLTTLAGVFGYGDASGWMAKYFFASIIQMNSFKLVEYSNDPGDIDLLRFFSVNDFVSKELPKHLSGQEKVMELIDGFVKSLADSNDEEGNKEEK